MTKPQELKNDPDVKIPAAVKAAAARSEELFRSMNPGAVTPEGNEGAAEAGKEAEGKPQGAADPKTPPKQEKKAGEPPLTPNPGEPQEKGSEQAGTAEKTAPQTDPDGESLEHRYKSVVGRYKQSQEKNRELLDTIRNLENVIATMQISGGEFQQAPAEEHPADPATAADYMLTPDELNDYGEDFLKVVGKKARAELEPIIKGYKDEIERLKKRLDGVSGFVKQDQQTKLLSTLDEKLPRWRELNTNQQFLDWLSLPDPYSGGIRHDMLKAAYAQGNPSRVLAFFNGFLAEEAAVAPVKEEPAVGQETVGKVPLQNLAAPGRAKTAASEVAPAEKPIVTRAQIAAFYADSAAGRYRGRDEEKAKIEKLIFEAQRDGRIR